MISAARSQTCIGNSQRCRSVCAMPHELRSVRPAVRDLKEVECRHPIGWEDREGATTASKRYRLIVAHKAQLGCLCRPRRGTASLRRAIGHQRPDQRKFAPEADHRKRSEEHTSELQSLMRISYAVFCLKTNK